MPRLFGRRNQNGPGMYEARSFGEFLFACTRSCGECVELRLRLCDRNTRFQPRDDGEGAKRFAVQWNLAFQQRINLKTIGHRQPDLWQVLKANAAETWCRNSDNCELLPINDCSRSEYTWVGREVAVPKIVAQHNDWVRARIVIRRNNNATKCRVDAESLKIISCDHAGIDALCPQLPNGNIYGKSIQVGGHA